MPLVKVVVMLKPSLLDAQGRVVQNALHSMGYDNVDEVRIGKQMLLTIDAPYGDADANEKLSATVKEMCDRLLANPVIENYQFEVVE